MILSNTITRMFVRTSWSKNIHCATKKIIREVNRNRIIKAAVLHGPRTLNIEDIQEKTLRPDQVRVDVHYCGISESDVLLWSGEHYRVPEELMVLGFEATGTVLEMGKLADEKLGLMWGEEVVFHNYPACGAFAETCLVDYRDVFKVPRQLSMKKAAVIMEDYFSSLTTLGRRASVQRNEYIFINSDRSQSALAAVDLCTRVFGARPIVVSNDQAYRNICSNLGAVATLDRNNEDCIPEKLKEITGNKQVRVILEAEGESRIIDIKKCFETDGIIAFLNSARDRKCGRAADCLPPNSVVFAAAAEHYKAADALVYRETMERVLQLRSTGVLRPRISAIFGLSNIEEAFRHHPTSYGRILIDLKESDRRSYLLPLNSSHPTDKNPACCSPRKRQNR